MNLLRPILAAVAFLASSPGHASEPVPNVTVVCEIFDTLKDLKSPPTGLMALNAQNGVRCKTEGPRGALDFFPIVSEDHTQVTLSGTATLENHSTAFEVTEPLGTTKYLGAIKATDSTPAKSLFLGQGTQRTAGPGTREAADKVAITFERITLPVSSAAELLKLEKGQVDARAMLDLTRVMIAGGSAKLQTIGPLRIPFGQMEKVTTSQHMLMVDPQLSEDRQWLTISLNFKSGKTELVSTLKIKHGDAVFVGTLEPEETGSVTLAMLRTASSP